MEKSNIAVEENSHTSDIGTPVSKSLGSLIQIDSISIDLDIPMPKKEEGNCQHFSIRGYVAEMRKKDRKICSPFTSISDDRSISEEQLPPLSVPKSRWWRCKNCIHEIGTECAGEEIEILSPSCRSRLTSTNMASTSATTNALLEMKHESTSRKGDRNKAVIDDSPNTSGYDDFLCNLYKGRCTLVEEKTVTAGNRTGSGSVRNEEIRYPTIEVAKSKHCSSQEIDRKSPAANLSNSDSTLSGGKIVPHGNLYTSADDVSADIGAETTARGSPNDKSLETSKTKLSRLPSIELTDHNETSSGSDTILSKNRQSGLHNDIPNDVPRRKTRKVRLLTDILGGQVNLETSHAKADRNSLSHAKADRNSSSTTTVVPSEPEPVGTPKDKRYCQKKRKMSQEVDSNLSEMGIQCNVAKRVRSFNGGAERSSMVIEIADSRSDEKESEEEGIPNGTKGLRIKHRNGVNKKRNKQLRPEMPWQDTTMENSGSKGYGAVNMQYSSMSEKFEPHLSSYQSLVGKDRDSDLCWKSSKFPEVGRVPSTLMHPDNNFPGECSTRRKNLLPVTTDIEMVTFQPAHELSAKVRLDLSLNSFRDSDKHAENDMTNWPFILRKGNTSSDPQRKDNTLVRQSNVPESSHSSRKGVIYDLNQGVPQTSSMWQDIQNSPILLQKGNLHIPETMEMPHRHNKENLNDFLEHSDVIKHHKYQHSEKTLERGLSDDIPMEIVELMAKNQYERGLTDTRTKSMIERTDSFARPYTEIHESEAVTWSRPGVTSFRPGNANLKTDIGTSRGSSLQNSHVKRNYLGMERPPTKIFGTFPQTQQKFSSGGQGSPSVHIRPGLQRGEEAKPVWFPPGQNMPLGLGIPQKSIRQPNDKMIQKGRTISDIKCGDVRMQNEPHLFFQKSGNADLNVKGTGSLDPYCNETIPAMQLLSLMDRRMPSNPPFNLDANKLLEKPFSPCSYHPRFHMDGKQSILNGSYLSHQHLKESPGVHPGGYYADQISFKSRGQEKSRKSYAPSRCGGSKLERFASSSGLLSMARDSCPEKNEQNGTLGTSSSRVLPQQDRNTSKFFDLEGYRAVPIKSNCESYICSLNQNPAEFSVPDERNPFTRTIKDPRIGKKSSSRERSQTVDLNKRKQRRITKERVGRPPAYTIG
ncbi:protein EMBRYONIC FLOWER 1-like isoform X1 [Lycium barbarum]|uniref:protein EMBRYONIC FLOWER 1-like isoform X1 n=1 Tax=Lycium barbarum TaxID=112863 RepID=UPI00293ED974|nr:protein EMBRYONIC FLOWER 1-like isoform X1 [Lycium barbarum]